MLAAATKGWASVHAGSDTNVIVREVACWCHEKIGEKWTIRPMVIADNGCLAPAESLPGFLGLVDPGDRDEHGHLHDPQTWWTKSKNYLKKRT